jgi:thiol-disulfide isomerase/thioredoxin
MMKRWNGFTMALLCISILTGCKGTESGYVIDGVVPEGIADGKYVYMTDLNDDLLVDSAMVTDGAFQFKGEADSAVARSLSVNRLSVDLIVENGKMTVDMSNPYSAEGNKMTEKMNAYLLDVGEKIMEARKRLENLTSTLSDSERGEAQVKIVDELLAHLNELPESYLKGHTDDVLGAMIIYAWLQNQVEPSAEQIERASRVVSRRVMDFGPIKQMTDFYNRASLTEEGKPFVDFTIETGNPDGSSVSLSDYVGKGKYVLVDFWASWCGPCRKEAPVIAAVYKKYKGARFEVLGVAVWDNREATLQAIEEDGNTWPQILDAQSIPTDIYGIQGIPHIILFGPDGTILARDLRGENLKNKIAEVMAQ